MATARCNVPPEVLKRLHDIFENVQGISFDDILSFQTLQPVQCCVDRHVFSLLACGRKQTHLHGRLRRPIMAFSRTLTFRLRVSTTVVFGVFKIIAFSSTIDCIEFFVGSVYGVVLSQLLHEGLWS